jgi:hypothetical protein
MTSRRSFSPEAIDPLVRDHLEALSLEIDVERNLAVIMRRARETPAEATDNLAVVVGRPRRLLSARPGWRWAVAASLVVACGMIWYLAAQPEPASAFALLSAAETELARPIDRCYRVEAVMPKVWRRNNPWLRTDSPTLVWTRGDRYRVAARHDGHDVTWGQDHAQRLWIAVDGQPGMRYERDEVPPMFARPRAYLGLDARKLANRFLRQFDLDVGQRRRVAGVCVVVIQATAKQGLDQWPFNAATLEIEARSKVIRKLELVREVDGQQKARFTFTLVDEAVQPEASYELEGNLRNGAEVLDDKQPDARESLRRQLTGAAD